MDKNPVLLLILFVLLSSLCSPSIAEIKSEKITGDSRHMILFENFGFTPRGHVAVSVSDVSFTSTLSSPDPSLLGFFLLSEENLLQTLYESQQQNPNPNADSDNSFCALSSPYVHPLFTFRDLSPAPFKYSFNNSFPITSPGEYSLFFANCAPECQVTMSVRTEMYNVQSDGSRDYLSAGLSLLPYLYFFFAFVYYAFMGLWIYVCSYKNGSSTGDIHVLMGLLLLVKCLYLICAGIDQKFIMVTGTSHGLDLVYYSFQFVKGIYHLTVMVAIGSGVSFLKPVMHVRERTVLLVAISLQVLASAASVVIGETGPFIQDWMTWNLVFLLTDIICCGTVMFPIVWSIQTLWEKSKTDGKAAANLEKLTLFRQFYIVVLWYLYSTRIVVFALKMIAVYKYRWVSVAADEAANLAFYVIVFYMFRPAERNANFVIGDEEEEAAQVALRKVESEL